MPDLTFAQKLDIADTLALILTLIVVVFYTRETFRLRKAAERQLALAEEQILLLRKGAAREAATYESEEEERASRQEKELQQYDAVLKYQAAEHIEDANFLILTAMNVGKHATNISVTSDGDHEVLINVASLPWGGIAKITANNIKQPQDSFRFTLHFDNEQGDKRSRRYEYVGYDLRKLP